MATNGTAIEIEMLRLHDAAAGSVVQSACGMGFDQFQWAEKVPLLTKGLRARRIKSGMVLHIDEGRVDPGHLTN
jgi:hypothetical protein